MEQIYKSLRNLVTDDMTAKMAKRLNAKESDISQAVSATFAGFLALTQMNGDTPKIRNIFEEAGSLGVLSKIELVFGELFSPETISIRDNFIQHVLGDHATGFTTGISLGNDLPKVTINRLVAVLAPVFAGYVGDKLLSNRWSMCKFLGLISSQKGTYREFIPKSIFGELYN